MNPETKVTFTLTIGYGTAQEDTFTLADLGYDPKVDTNPTKFIEEAYKDWRSNFIDGGWHFSDAEDDEYE